MLSSLISRPNNCRDSKELIKRNTHIKIGTLILNGTLILSKGNTHHGTLIITRNTHIIKRNTHTIKRNTHHQNGTLIMEHSYYQKEYSSWNTHIFVEDIGFHDVVVNGSVPSCLGFYHPVLVSGRMDSSKWNTHIIKMEYSSKMEHSYYQNGILIMEHSYYQKEILIMEHSSSQRTLILSKGILILSKGILIITRHL